MRPSSTQWIREARPLAGPWSLFMFAGWAVLAHRWLIRLPDSGIAAGLWGNVSDWILPGGAFLGSSLLAALPLGSEFQYGTLTLRLAQAVERRILWRQKLLVTLAAVAPLAATFCLALNMRFGRPFTLMVACWIFVTTAGAIPLTLLARSTLGGMVLNNFGSSGVTLAWAYYENHGRLPSPLVWSCGIFLAAYAVVMTWLGRRLLLRFEVVDPTQGSEILSGTWLLPRAVIAWMRCRPTQPLLNLLRREFHLLRMLWPLTLLYAALWIFIVVFQQLPTNHPDSVIAFGLTVTLGVVLAVLAGTVSLGEEKTSGTYEWQMTAPVSVSMQWVVKLVVAVLGGVVCSVLVPIAELMLAAWINGSAAHFLHASPVALWILEAVVITLTAFLCACVVKGAVQASLCVFPLCFAVLWAIVFASWLLEQFEQPLHRFLVSVLSRADAVRIESVASSLLDRFMLETRLEILTALLLIVVLIQSHRFFRSQRAATKLQVLRCALPLLIVAFLGSLGSGVLMRIYETSWQQAASILRETDAVIATVQSQRLQNEQRAQLSPADLTSAAPLSDATRRWLGDANISITLTSEHFGNSFGPYVPGLMSLFVRSSREAKRASYSAVVRRANGRECSLKFQAQNQGPVGLLTAICE